MTDGRPAAQQSLAAAHRVELPDPDTLTGPQLEGWHCALCGRRLYADQLLGTVEWICGSRPQEVELWVCRPLCREA
ncbi:hypothetical protein ADL28_42555 [Streptomyces violaceusniger]|uniref:Uncharacterized protein n=3 Tax=Streptomyces TaxID=1883 RepID=A0ABD5J9N7_9ACTN|nr:MULTISPECIES: hypothetical protein [Streptomyces]MEE4584644.1 hypothetical protein [Streptomyces sp. DSM 41602]WTA82913.1 hypothetical protein OG751_25125 [Streptomyces antimycoticus]KUL43576.1 hypothetical protein ADL28_42555 [Streptomyces violaceusniger]RSS47668.1 hypothetical protein EF902_08835 [Streptomyces sp. WAC05858]WTB06606.1 hypothetical protein OG546_21790 [Streptomyces antimycoticus]